MKVPLEESKSTDSTHRLVFDADGICIITLQGLPQPAEIERLIEDYVAGVELHPWRLKMILLDISRLQHMQARTRQVFSELLIQASHHYDDGVYLAVAGGPCMIRRYTEFFCKALKFGDRFHSFDTLEQAFVWLKKN